MKDNSKVLAALLAGIAAGAAIGILFAPERGTETRDRIGDSLRNLSDSLKDRAADEIEHLASMRERMVDSIKSKMRNAETDAGQRSTFNGAGERADSTVGTATNS